MKLTCILAKTRPPLAFRLIVLAQVGDAFTSRSVDAPPS